MTQAPKTGIGWRHAHYAQVLAQRPSVGFLEVHSENFFGQGGAALATLAAAREHYAVSLHGVGLSLGSACGLDHAHLEQLATLVERIDPVRVSDHACFARAPAPSSGPSSDTSHLHAADLLPLPFTHDALELLGTHVQQVQDRLKRVLAVEHLSAYMAWRRADFSEVEFFNTLTQRTGCQLLLDVNNLYVNALNDQLAGRCTQPLAQAQQWLAAIRPGSVAEIHLAGHCVMADIVIDDHGSRVAPPVWALFEQACQRFPSAPALVEWDTDVPELAVLLQEAAHADTLRAAASASASA